VTIAVLSDVHANLEALSAVLRKVDLAKPDVLVSLGDLVGYNADPEACVSVVLDRAAASVRGNHDKAVAGLMGLEWFNPVAAEAARWTRRAIGSEALARLSRLAAGPVAMAGGVLLCHGTPYDEDEYLVSESAVEEAFRTMEREHPEARYCLHGHTHAPLAVELTGGRWRRLAGSPIRLETPSRYLLNPGSVGQPRDGNPRASFGILDTSRGSWRIVRVPYDVEGARGKIVAARLPAELAQRLVEGW
jgi:diadenosine tetraphosphatase ApaH/serine/threonine PP2A family protein phosphatase